MQTGVFVRESFILRSISNLDAEKEEQCVNELALDPKYFDKVKL